MRSNICALAAGAELGIQLQASESLASSLAAQIPVAQVKPSIPPLQLSSFAGLIGRDGRQRSNGPPSSD